MFSRKPKPTKVIKDALGDLLNANEHTRGSVPAEMYLGEDIFIVHLRRPRVIEGQHETVDRTVDIFDLMDEHKRSNR